MKPAAILIQTLTLLIVIITSATVAVGQDGPLAVKLQNVLKSEIELQEIQGLSAAVLVPDRIYWAGAEGYSEGRGQSISSRKC